MAKSTDKGKKATAKVSDKKTTAKKVTAKSPVTKKATTKSEKVKEKKSAVVSKKVADKKVEKVSVKKVEKPAKPETSEKKNPVSMTESPVVKVPKIKKEKASKAPKAKEEKVAKAPKVKKEKPYEVRNDKELLGIEPKPSNPAPIVEPEIVVPIVEPTPIESPSVIIDPVLSAPEVIAPEVTAPEVVAKNDDEVVIVNASNISEMVNSMPDISAVNQAVPAQHGFVGQAHPVVAQSSSLLTSKAITHGDSILHLINSDWRMHAWGGVPIEHIQAVVATGSAEYQYEIKTSEQGAYFLLKYGTESHRFPQDENAFIKIK